MFVTGQPARPGPGRPKGAENTRTKEVRKLAQKLATDKIYQKRLLERLRAGEAGPMEPTLWHYAFGKPKESVAHTFNLSKLSDEELDQFEAFVRRVS